MSSRYHVMKAERTRDAFVCSRTNKASALKIARRMNMDAQRRGDPTLYFIERIDNKRGGQE